MAGSDSDRPPGRPLSADATATDDHVRGIISDLTPHDVRRGSVEQRGWRRLLLGIVLSTILALGLAGALFLLITRTRVTYVEPAPPLAPAGSTWAFTSDPALGPVVTVTLLGTGPSGSIAVVGSPDGTGSFTWSDRTLTVDFDVDHAVAAGITIRSGGTVTCQGDPSAATLPCVMAQDDWLWSQDRGREDLPPQTYEVTGTRVDAG